MIHRCTIDCWENGCDVHEVCTANICIPAATIAAEYRRQAATADPSGAATLLSMAREMEGPK